MREPTLLSFVRSFVLDLTPTLSLTLPPALPLPFLPQVRELREAVVVEELEY